MTLAFFDICKGAIPGSTRLFPYAQIVKGTCLALGSMAVLPSLVQQILKTLPATNEKNGQVYRLVPSLVSLRYRKVVLGGAVLVAATCMIGLLYPYLQIFLNSPYPKSFILRFREWTPHSVTLIAGVVVLVGENIISSCFGVQITRYGVYMSRDSLTPLERLKIRFFGPKNQISRPKLPVQTEPKPPVQTEAVGFCPLPWEIVRAHIFPRALNDTENFQAFFILGQVCVDWRDHLLHRDCLIPRYPYRHFLWKAFRCQKFDPIEVAAFFQRYLPKGHQGEGLRLPLRFLNCTLEDSLTAQQLSYIFTRFPQASVDSLTLRLDSKDNVEEVARCINLCLEPKRKLYCLTIRPERFINDKEAALYGKLLPKEEFDHRHYFELCCRDDYDPKKGYPDQVMKLLPLLKGRVSFLRIDFRRASGDKDLDPVPIVKLFHPSFSKPFLSVGRLDLSYSWILQCPPHKDLEKIEALIKDNGSFIHLSPPDPGQSLIDDTQLVKDDPEHSQELEIRRTMFLS
jgi:hypothetical protein